MVIYMSISSKIEKLFEQGYEPAEVVRMGYPRSTVYSVYKRWLERKKMHNYIYIAYDIEPEFLERFVNQLRLTGFNTIIGGNTHSTLRHIDYSRIVIALVSRIPGYRRQLLYEELSKAMEQDKQLIILVEEGAMLPIKASSNIIVLSFNKNNIRKTVSDLLRIINERKNQIEDPLVQLLAAIGIALVVAFGIIAFVELVRVILEFLSPKSK